MVFSSLKQAKYARLKLSWDYWNEKQNECQDRKRFSYYMIPGKRFSALRKTRGRFPILRKDRKHRPSSLYPLAPQLRFDDISLRTLDECNDLVAFDLRYFERLQRGIEMPQEGRPIVFADFHPFMRDLHIPPGVVQRPACTGAEKIDQQLLLPPHAVLAAILPETSQARIILQARQ